MINISYNEGGRNYMEIDFWNKPIRSSFKFSFVIGGLVIATKALINAVSAVDKAIDKVDDVCKPGSSINVEIVNPSTDNTSK